MRPPRLGLLSAVQGCSASSVPRYALFVMGASKGPSKRSKSSSKSSNASSASKGRKRKGSKTKSSQPCAVATYHTKLAPNAVRSSFIFAEPKMHSLERFVRTAGQEPEEPLAFEDMEPWHLFLAGCFDLLSTRLARPASAAAILEAKARAEDEQSRTTMVKRVNARVQELVEEASRSYGRPRISI
eukprot:Skav234203  [mRNA]  locus=scaffold2795:61273:65034:- [translate_table: standard]